MWGLCTSHCVEVLMKLQLTPVSEGNLAKGKWEHSLWRWHPWLIHKKQALVFSECAGCESWMLIKSDAACKTAEKTTCSPSSTGVPPQSSVGCVSSRSIKLWSISGRKVCSLKSFCSMTQVKMKDGRREQTTKTPLFKRSFGPVVVSATTWTQRSSIFLIGKALPWYWLLVNECLELLSC